ncbi:hypothetical protein STEG23_035629 [Scotinomys teguina]
METGSKERKKEARGPEVKNVCGQEFWDSLPTKVEEEHNRGKEPTKLQGWDAGKNKLVEVVNGASVQKKLAVTPETRREGGDAEEGAGARACEFTKPTIMIRCISYNVIQLIDSILRKCKIKNNDKRIKNYERVNWVTVPQSHTGHKNCSSELLVGCIPSPPFPDYEYNLYPEHSPGLVGWKENIECEKTSLGLNGNRKETKTQYQLKIPKHNKKPPTLSVSLHFELRSRRRKERVLEGLVILVAPYSRADLFLDRSHKPKYQQPAGPLSTCPPTFNFGSSSFPSNIPSPLCATHVPVDVDHLLEPGQPTGVYTLKVNDSSSQRSHQLSKAPQFEKKQQYFYFEPRGFFQAEGRLALPICVPFSSVELTSGRCDSCVGIKLEPQPRSEGFTLLPEQQRANLREERNRKLRIKLSHQLPNFRA